MKLYDIFYYGSTFDRSTSLPPATPDIKEAVNINWAGEVLAVRKDANGKSYWHCQKHNRPYAECTC